MWYQRSIPRQSVRSVHNFLKWWTNVVRRRQKYVLEEGLHGSSIMLSNINSSSMGARFMQWNKIFHIVCSRALNIETKELHFLAQKCRHLFSYGPFQTTSPRSHWSDFFHKPKTSFIHILDIHGNRLKSSNHGTVIRACSQLETLFVLYVRTVAVLQVGVYFHLIS